MHAILLYHNIISSYITLFWFNSFQFSKMAWTIDSWIWLIQFYNSTQWLHNLVAMVNSSLERRLLVNNDLNFHTNLLYDFKNTGYVSFCLPLWCCFNMLELDNLSLHSDYTEKISQNILWKCDPQKTVSE